MKPDVKPSGKANVHAVILAGGGGERLWPLSTLEHPKPFVKLFGDQSLLRQTVERAVAFVGQDCVWVVTTAALVPLVRSELPDIPPEQLIVEPFGKDTAPCVALAASILGRRTDNPILAIMPADHHIPDHAAFLKVLSLATRAAAQGHIVILGIRPNRPETGYGYIEVGAPLEGLSGIHKAVQFVEKPDRNRAEEMVLAGRFYWNAGIFVAKARKLLDAYREHLPEMGRQLESLAEAAVTGDQSRVGELYAEFPRVSLDYGVMEKTRGLVVVPVEFEWDDLGSWTALSRVLPADEHGNVLVGPAWAIESRDTIVHTDAPNTLVLGVDGVVVVRRQDRVLVCGKQYAGRLKDALQVVKEQAATITPTESDARTTKPKIVPKPWGREIWWADTPHYMGKVLEIKAGHRLSLQYHQCKHETLLVQTGSGFMIVGGRTFDLWPGVAVTIPPGTVHRLEAVTDLCLLEVSTPHPDDVVRLEDAYGRTPSNEQ